MPVGLDTNFRTLADELRDLHYSTHIVGKWHLGFCNKKFWPTNRGFDHHYGYHLPREGHFDHTYDDGYDFYDDEQVELAANGTYSTYLFQ